MLCWLRCRRRYSSCWWFRGGSRPSCRANTAFSDEALYLWAGHLEWAHWLDGAKIPVFPAYFSGSPVVYPPLGAVADSIGGLVGATAEHDVHAGCHLAAVVDHVTVVRQVSRVLRGSAVRPARSHSQVERIRHLRRHVAEMIMVPPTVISSGWVSAVTGSRLARMENRSTLTLLLTPAQQRVIDDNLGTIRTAIRKYMAWYRNCG